MESSDQLYTVQGVPKITPIKDDISKPKIGCISKSLKEKKLAYSKKVTDPAIFAKLLVR